MAARDAALLETVLFVAALVALSFVGSVTKSRIEQARLGECDRGRRVASPKSEVAARVENGTDVCASAGCASTAAVLIEALDPAIDPCHDFYQFVCGRWVERNPIPRGFQAWSQFEVVGEEVARDVREILEEEEEEEEDVASDSLRKARDTYRACLETSEAELNAFDPTEELVELFGDWPMLADQWDGVFRWQPAAAAISASYGASFLVHVYTGVRLDDTSRHLIYIDRGWLPRSDASLAAERGDADVDVESKFNETLALATEWTRHLTGSDAADAGVVEADVRHLVAFETRLAQITKRPETDDSDDLPYELMTLGQLQNWTDAIGTGTAKAQMRWSDHLNAVYNETVGVAIGEDEPLAVLDLEYLRQLFGLLDVTENRVLSNFFHWQLIDMLSGESHANQQPALPRWRTCVSRSTEALAFSVGAEYVRRRWDGAAAGGATASMIDAVGAAFAAAIDDAVWMEPAVRRAARRKLDAVDALVAHPDWILQPPLLDQFYRDLATDRRRHTFNNRNVKQFYARLELAALRRSPADRLQWDMHPTTVNALYVQERNSVVFPAAILQWPFYSDGLAATNYGALGSTIGHEIMHAFDNEGRRADHDGNRVAWWSPASLAEYHNRTQCFVDQFSSYYPAHLNGTVHLDGKRTLDENMADSGGLRQAYRAYRSLVQQRGQEARLPGLEHYTPDQIFFISFAYSLCGSETPAQLSSLIASDEHSPAYYQIVGSLSNSDEFARHFGCAEDSAMNPPHKCVLW